MALGYKIDHGSKRREELEGFRYSTESATKLTQDLYDKFDKDVLDNNQKEDLEAAIHALTVAKVRSDYSDLHNVDLISYTSEAQKEAEFYKLKDAILLMQVELGKKLRDGGAELLGVPGATLQSVVSEKAAELTQLIHQDVTGKDEAFHKYRRKKALKKGAIAVGVGAGVGMLAQEAVTALPGGRVGLAEQIFNGDELAEGGEQTKTFLNGIITGGDVHTGASEQFTAYNFGEHGSIKITDDHTIVKNPDGTMNLVDKNGNVSIENVPIESDGRLSPDSIKLLEDNGMEVKGGVHTQEVAKEIPMQEYLAKHPEELREFDNVSLYDNDTPSIFDLNEQGGRLSYNPDGTVNIGQNMTPDGSFNSGGSIEMAKGSSLHVIAIKQPDGTHLHKIFEYGQPIDKPWSDMLYQKSDGTWGYKGDGYIAWGQANGEQLHVAASIAGDNQPLPPFEEKISVEYPHYEITSSGYDTNVNIDAPPIIPVVYRSPLETLSRRNRNGLTNPDISPFYYGGGSLERMRDWIGSNPDMLRTRKRVTGPDGKQQWLEADGTAIERNVGRERDTIKKYLDHESATNPEHFRMMEQVAASLGEMDDANRVSINVPAWMEGRSLEHFLGEYVKQTDKQGDVLDPNLYEINILINRETGAVPDDSVEVIEKFIADFERTNGERPNIRYADVELDTGYNNVGYARKLLTDATMLRSLRRQNQAESLYIESEDADMISIDKRTVVNLMTKLDENPELDAVRGVQDRSPEHMKENDMLFLRRRAWDFFEIMARSKQFRNPTSPRWNFTFNRTVTGGWNTGYSAEAYVLIGGYEVVQAGEDMSIGEKMTMIRGNGDVPNLDVVGTVSSRSNSSPRRFINEIAKQKDAYADFTNPEDNKDIRQKSLDELLDSIKDYERINDSNKKEFEHYIASTYEWAKSATPTEQDAKQFERRLLFWLGFKQGDYEIENGSVKVKSWDNIKSSLDSYRNRYSS